MRSFAIAAFAAAVNAFPAQYHNNAAAPAAVTVTDITEVYTTVYADEPVAPTTPVAAATTPKYQIWKPKTSPAAPVVVVSETPPTYEAPAATTPAAPTTPVATTPAYTAPAATTPVVSAPAPASTSAAATAAGKAPTDYAQTVVDHHNAHRANHSAPALVWDAALAATALKIAQSCNYAHDTYEPLTLHILFHPLTCSQPNGWWWIRPEHRRRMPSQQRLLCHHRVVLQQRGRKLRIHVRPGHPI